MTADLRRAYKRAVDAAVRERELADGRPRCKGCECLLDLYTTGCKQCGWRKWNRMRRAKPNRCRNCGCHRDDLTVGCRNCKERHRQRRLNRAA